MSIFERFITSACMTFSFAILANCSNVPTKTNNDRANLKWGYMPHSTQHLINLPSGSTIRVCGAYTDSIAWAINSWAQAIDRNYSVVTNCTNQHINSYAASHEYAQTQCQKWHLEGRMFTFESMNPQLVVDCGGYRRSAILHETGHLFGLCDQYPNQLFRCAHNNGIVRGAVMNTASSETLTQDDVDGIRALAKYAASFPH